MLKNVFGQEVKRIKMETKFRLDLYRIEKTEECVRGILVLNGEFLCHTLERPWVNNKINISCIPAGKYVLAPFTGKEYKNVYEVLAVQGRTGILFHIGNTVNNSKGCILPGMRFGMLGDKRAVLSSGTAVKLLRRRLKQDNHTLTIHNTYKETA